MSQQDRTSIQQQDRARSQQQNREEIEKHFIKIDAREQQERENRLKLEELKRRVQYYLFLR